MKNIDCLDNTPLLDIKPYFASVDSKPDATVGWHRDKTFASVRPRESGDPATRNWIPAFAGMNGDC